MRLQVKASVGDIHTNSMVFTKAITLCAKEEQNSVSLIKAQIISAAYQQILKLIARKLCL